MYANVYSIQTHTCNQHFEVLYTKEKQGFEVIGRFSQGCLPIGIRRTPIYHLMAEFDDLMAEFQNQVDFDRLHRAVQKNTIYMKINNK